MLKKLATGGIGGTMMNENEIKKGDFTGPVINRLSEAAGTANDKTGTLLTRDEADSLLNWLSFMKKTLVCNLRRDELKVIAELYIKITDEFPSLIESESELFFWERCNQELKSLPQQEKVVPVDIIRKRINTELEKLNRREEIIRSRHIRVALGHQGIYRVNGRCPAEIIRRLNADREYQFIIEQKRKLKFELTRILEANKPAGMKKS